ncbi:hypothetical protein [Nocardiopsis baichengensis]|uniref:hypothetical protein n=1 Tax=Nocardiopsis baichengensis TaxID=280240 RepID=UPI00035CB4F4|nr:hypothetical protein [Nocardiopsis baichengensis]
MLTAEQALTGQGRAAMAAAEKGERHRAAEREQALREELERLEPMRTASRLWLLRQGTGRRAVERRWEQASGQLGEEIQAQRQARAAAEHVRREAVRADVAQARAEQAEHAKRERRVVRAAAELGIARGEAERLPEWMLDPLARRAMRAGRPIDGADSGPSTGRTGPPSAWPERETGPTPPSLQILRTLRLVV